MLVLLFYLGDVMYTIECQHVREIAPMVTLKELPRAPEFFAGFFNYRGMIAPVIDLRRLIHGVPCQMRLSTRILLIDYLQRDSAPSVYGLIAERVTEAAKKLKQEFITPDVKMQEAPYLGSMIMEEDRMIHHVDVKKLTEHLSFLHTIETRMVHASNDD
ncbi:MAG: chemotaxis protein CheW [Candidatus Vecturithrix sp.]|jgi:chemotaxis-related protein WspB|nr:chemotaxis protein CheW [Candidatus Vecturithrix sp.]